MRRLKSNGARWPLALALIAGSVAAALIAGMVLSGVPANAQTSVPSMPTGLTVASQTHDSVTLVWDDPGDSAVESYQILRRSRDGSEYGDGLGASGFIVAVDNTGSSATTHTDTSVTARTRYVYRVKARNGNGLSDASVYANAETPDVPPDPPPPTGPSRPTGLAVSSASHDSVTLTWDDPGDSTVESYQILRLRDGLECGDGRDAPEFVVIVDDTGSSASTHTDTSVTVRTRYFYRVKARSPHGLSEASSSADVETPNAPPDTPPPMAPSMPTGLTVASVSHDRVALTWDDPGDSRIERYQILRRSRDGSRYGDGSGAREFVVIVDDIGPSATSYTDSSVSARTRYVYRVQARNSRGLSIVSVYADAETLEVPPDPPPPDPPPPPGRPSRPTGLAAPSASHDSVTLTWDDPGDSMVESYQILRCSHDGSRYGDGRDAPEFVVIVDNTGSPATTYTDTSATAWKRYFYRVRARSPQGLSVASSSAGVETPYAPDSRPNVVLILADDLGWGDIQSNNPDSAMTTPNIDSMAASGANFTDAHSPSAACSPTRYGLLTGRYAWRTWLTGGVLNGSDRPLIGRDRATLGTLLQHYGYRTAAIGKWHLGMDFARLSNVHEVTEVNQGIDFAADIPDSPIDHGFDEFFGTSANLTWRVPVYIRNNRFTAIPQGMTLPALGNISNQEVLDRLTEEAVSFIERAAPDDAPFFLYLPLNAPHEPLAPNANFRGSTDLGHYGDFVAQIDWTVGQVLDTLDRVGASDNTLVIFTSDNGSFMGRLPNHFSNDHTKHPQFYKYRIGTHQSNSDWREQKGSIYEGGHRVPFVVQWPAVIQPGSALAATVSLIDLYATLADIVGEAPEPGVAPDSVSLLPLLQAEAATRGAPVVHHSSSGEFAIRDGRWKLVFHNPRELYDLQQNPEERKNLAASHPEVVAQLEATLAGIRSAEDGTLSSDATLQSLRLAGIDIGAFTSDVRTYAATVDRRIGTVEVMAIPTETDATVVITTPDGRLLYGKPDRGRVPVRLSESNTTVNVTVTSPDEGATAKYTVIVTRADEVPEGPTITGTARVGEMLTVDTSSIADAEGLHNPVYRYQWIRSDGSTDTDIVGATGTTYILTSEDEGKTILVRVSFTDGRSNAETRTSAATTEVQAPLTADFQDVPASHDGSGRFVFRILFSEPVDVDSQALRDALEVFNGIIEWAERVGGRDDLQEITVQPSSRADVLLVLPTTADCAAEGAVCTSGGKRLSSRLEITVPGPAPAISGTAQVGETLSVDTSGIADADGLSGTAFIYQWVSNDGDAETDIQGATGATYTLVEADQGKTIRVRVSFTDDADNTETLTSAATVAVATPPPANTPATGTPAMSGNPWVGETLTADRLGISDSDGLTNTVLAYQWIRVGADSTGADIIGATGTTYILVEADEGKTIKVRASFTDDADNSETLTSVATSEVEAALTAELQNVPDGHNGSGTFAFSILFSQAVTTGYQTLKQHSFEVSNGVIKRAQRVNGRNDLWKITIQPSADDDVVLVLPATADCANQGAVCTSNGKRLSTRLTLTVQGPAPANTPANTPATGAPTISG